MNQRTLNPITLIITVAASMAICTAAHADNGEVTTQKVFKKVVTLETTEKKIVKKKGVLTATLTLNGLFGLIDIEYNESVMSTTTTQVPIYNIVTTQRCTPVFGDDIIRVFAALGTGNDTGTSLVSPVSDGISLEDGTSVLIDSLMLTGDPLLLEGDAITVGQTDDLAAVLPVGFDDSLLSSTEAGEGETWWYYSFDVPVSRFMPVPGPGSLACIASGLLLVSRRRR